MSSKEKYKYLFPFERSFDAKKHQVWLADNWTISIYISIFYVIIIFTGQAFMKNRSPFRLRKFLLFWNFGLAVFSFLGSIRLLPELYETFHKYGFYGVICNSSYVKDEVVLGWAYLFVYSKVFELGDTILIILRKQELIFLQWYHHFSTMIYCFYSFIDYPAVARLFTNMNYTVHTIMYTYYALRVLRFKTPGWVPMSITIAQIVQMIIGLGTAIYIYLLKTAGYKCDVNVLNIKLALGLYFTLGILFVLYFRKRYLEDKISKEKKTT